MINKEILNYKIIRQIGEGGMAKVYLAEHKRLGNKVAIKILDEDLIRKTNIRQRFENEAKIMAGLNHPNIINVTDYYENENTIAIIMEYLEGESLSEYINRKGKLSKKDAIIIFKQVLDAFDFAHKNGIVHRDIKPSNIFIQDTLKGKRVKILDFGIAKLVSSDINLTGTGTQMGTPLYMSPEQVKDAKNIDNLSDIYSLGVVLYFMLKGKSAYDTNTLSKFDVFEKIIYEPLPKIEDAGNLNTIIQKATAKKPADRFMTCTAFENAIENQEKVVYNVSVNLSKEKSKQENKIDNHVLKNNELRKEKKEELSSFGYYKYVLANSFNFKGRARRKEYWNFLLWHIVIFFAIIFFVALLTGEEDGAVGTGVIYFVITLLATLSVSIRRLHDLGHSGWLYAITLIPYIGSIVLLILYMTEGKKEENKYGPNPKQ